ncbi:MAG: GNAT family N-acetyltransferase [Planctomycetota bacterium]|nr:GNAT family N-acetyltransferase [Planctomycetota bacterium]
MTPASPPPADKPARGSAPDAAAAPEPPKSPEPQVVRNDRARLDALFFPRSVAVLGAGELPGSVGRSVMWNLIRSPFGGAVFPINAERSSVLGVKTYADIANAPERVDLAVLALSPAEVPGAIARCAGAGVRGAIILSTGFRELGPAGLELERQTLAAARAGSVRLLGPGCLGLMSPHTGLNASSFREVARPGSVAFISQSGSLATATLDWALRENVGFSAFVTVGSMLDVGLGDLIDYLGDDPRTKSILIHMETIGDGRAFLAAAREVAMSKPIIVLHAGRSAPASRGMGNANGAGNPLGEGVASDAALDAVFRRTGLLRVERVSDLFFMAEVLSKQPRPRGDRLSILTNAAGPGVLAADALIEHGGRLAELPPATVQALDAILPASPGSSAPSSSSSVRSNPLNILSDADPERFARAAAAMAENPASDGLLVILSPQAATDPTQTAERLKALAHAASKPILASFMGGAAVAAGQSILNVAGIPTFDYPDTAARFFALMWRYSYNLAALYETPRLADDPGVEASRAAAGAILDAARSRGRVSLDEIESRRVLAAYGIPVVDTRFAADVEAAAGHARAIGFPVALKLCTPQVRHKAAVGGVRLDVRSEAGVREAWGQIMAAYEAAPKSETADTSAPGVIVQPMIDAGAESFELTFGSGVDPQFGPMLRFGAGGRLADVYHDHVLALPPLNTTLARRTMEQTRIFSALRGDTRRRAVDLHALERLLVRFSRLIAEQPVIQAVDINPLLAGPDRIVALDATILLHDPAVPRERLPRPAVRPYPDQYVWAWTSAAGEKAVVRPIRPEDEPAMVRFHESLSERSVYLRFFNMLQLSERVAHERLRRRCFVDYDREMALVVELARPGAGEGVLMGVGRLSRVHGTNDAEFSMLIGDQHQRQGVGTELLRRLLVIARAEGISRVVAEILPDNLAMQRVSERMGFKLTPDRREDVVRAVYDLRGSTEAGGG